MSDVFDVLAVSKYTKDGIEKTRYTRVGVAFGLKDGSPGMTVRLDASPVSGNLVIKPKTDRQVEQ
jgi:hypothetical protein